ncbi:M48 family metallopeptidase [Candidatus Micrarchaeota archaeon]|nr:M48 family metallopeptidase [Candidatus Micrarchaeota archaeon]MBU1165979.1 M48 family metallopeptidase [Candidatus Micrarchaeota archaeon]MBU1886940.1 M48 family metallopeptidase [Candidatus Micrarchaeota archaeon]
MDGKINFFDAIEANKRNSLILMGVMFFIFMALSVALSYIFDAGICFPILGFFFLLIYAIIVFYQGDKIILSMSGAKQVRKEEYPFLYNVVEGLALASQIPVPNVYVVDDPSPNAFATGRDPQHASVAVTSGLLSILKKEELEGVIAHEISHVANFDIRFSMIAVVFVGAISLLGSFAWRSMGLGFGGSNRGRGGGAGILILLALVFVILAPIFAQMVRFAISRQREYLADANAARLTRYPAGLAGALEKIKNFNTPTKSANDVTASLYISNPFPNKMGFLGSTHPPTDDRIKRLMAM